MTYKNCCNCIGDCRCYCHLTGDDLIASKHSQIKWLRREVAQLREMSDKDSTP